MKLNLPLDSKQANHNLYSCVWNSDLEVAGLRKLKGYMIHMPFSSIFQHSTGCPVKDEGKVNVSI